MTADEFDILCIGAGRIDFGEPTGKAITGLWDARRYQKMLLIEKPESCTCCCFEATKANLKVGECATGACVSGDRGKVSRDGVSDSVEVIVMNYEEQL